MNQAISPWDTIKHCQPVLSSVVDMEERVIRGEAWVVLRNRLNGLHLRLNSRATALLKQLDGKTRVESLCNPKRRESFSAEEVVSCLNALSSNGMIIMGADNDSERLWQKHAHSQKNQQLQRWKNPLFLRFPLINPDSLITWLSQRSLWLGHIVCLSLALACFILALLSALFHHEAIFAQTAQLARSPQHWWLYGVLYPLLKLVHELAHALAIKRWGGAVHEAGISLLVFIPLPYIDASDASLFASRRKRLWVSAAGMMAELLLASVALLLWMSVTPGVIKEVSFAVFLLGSVSVVLFNANPLLKFDGYYLLQDWLDIPNLSSRSQAYYRYCLCRYVFNLTTVRSPVFAEGERLWFLLYGAGSQVYRLVLTMIIALFLAEHYFVLGVMLALYSIWLSIVKPFVGSVKFIIREHQIQQQTVASARVATVFGGLVVLLLGVLVPVPSSTRAEGVVWVPEQAQLFAAHSGEVSQLHVHSGDEVVQGQMLMTLQEPVLQKELAVLQSQLDTRRVQLHEQQVKDTVKANQLAQDIERLERETIDLSNRASQLVLYAKSAGQFTQVPDKPLLGRRVKQGELLGYIVSPEHLVVQAVLSQQKLSRVQEGVSGTSVRLAEHFSESIEASLSQQTPAASNRLPSPSLAYDGQDGIAIANSTSDEITTIDRVFHLELSLPDKVAVVGIGGKAYVTLQHQPESLMRRWWRATRQVFLNQLAV